MARYPIRSVMVHEKARACALTREILETLSGLDEPCTVQEGTAQGSMQKDPQKDMLCLLPYRGEFLKPCPGTREYICCGYQILNIATNCPLDCSYCILQAYFNEPGLRVFINIEEGLNKVLAAVDSQPERIFRVGTGEFTDSLAMDPVAGWTDRLVPPFAKRKNAVLELKTKTVNIEKLLACGVRDRIIVSWSLNSPFVAGREEHGAASLRRRLAAAQRCQAEGFVLGFHFDPIIAHENWREEYLKTIELLDKYVDPKGIIWISLGSFRFMPSLKGIIRRRHSGTCVLDGEFVPGMDGKMRYFKPIRIELYAFLREALQAWHPDAGLYLCMESDEVWQKSMGWSPGNSDGLSRYLDDRVRKIFG